MKTDQELLLENEHTLESPQLIGTDEEKIAGIRFWADLVGLVRSINSTFISFENKKAVIDFLKKEVDLVDIEINNVSSQVVSVPGEIPSTEQIPPGEEPPEQNVVDLTKSAEVAATIPVVRPSDEAPPTQVTKAAPAMPQKKAPTFSDLDKLRRVAGTGNYDPSYITPEAPKTESTEPSADGRKAPTFTDLDKLRRVAGSGKWGKSFADKKKK